MTTCAILALQPSSTLDCPVLVSRKSEAPNEIRGNRSSNVQRSTAEDAERLRVARRISGIETRMGSHARCSGNPRFLRGRCPSCGFRELGDPLDPWHRGHRGGCRFGDYRRRLTRNSDRMVSVQLRRNARLLAAQGLPRVLTADPISVICGIGAIAPIQRTLLDLAGNVLAQSEVTLNAAAYAAPPGTIEGEMVSHFCSDPARRR